MTVGILALQGDFDRHQQKMATLSVKSRLVRTAVQLAQCDGLIIPGGESTTLINLLKKHTMWDSVRRFGKTKPVYGTCAGCILIADSIVEMDQDSLHLIDISVQRNAYGRQVDSFIDDVKVQLNGTLDSMEGVFIRAPKIVSIGANVTPLAWHNDDIILAEQANILAGTFHPELTDDVRIHHYFLRKIQKSMY
ncbi:pyridoxal 5'-phosphate synthase glutaminase subunit PdxT [candidate division KSB1 bacterium]|nr:pyridoxal 5'-phosphate synthase glutaminase subunit PdxT [candidate division KSB1 bacterium]RQW05050.1 MAG: pyridoxal 5'-phosphate synthase glutaminase subunit PdxT [candidate division KSB1 bacterium]